MEIRSPADCGNSPRTTLVGDLVVNWAAGDVEAVAQWLSDEASWTFVGSESHHGPDTAAKACPSMSPERVEVLSIVTHGRLAACDGYLEAGRTRVDFSHVFRFSGAAKTAKIVEVRTYIVETGRDSVE